jgi:hypothetical protein
MPVVSQVVAAGHPEWFAYWVELAPGRYTAVRTVSVTQPAFAAMAASVSCFHSDKDHTG